MDNLNYIKRILLAIFVFISPVFFLSTSAEYYSTNKFYLLVFFTLTLMLLNSIEIIFKKKINFMGNKIDLPLVLFLVALALSIIFSSTNKVQALVSTNLGLIPVFFIFVFYLFLSKSDEKTKLLIDAVLFYSSVMVSTVTIFLFFQPFSLITLPAAWRFLGLPLFTPLGATTDLVVFLSFATIYRIIRKKFSTADVVMLAINVSALGLSIFNLFKPNAVAIPPFRLSWYAALEILKTPQTALFGIGIDNFSIVFTRVKDAIYNQSLLWQINGFSVSRSIILHVLTEAGFIGLTSFLFVLYSAFRTTFNDDNKFSKLVMLLWVVIILFFPISFFTLFLFFLTLALLVKNHGQREINLNEGFPYYMPAALIIFVAIGVSGYLLTRSYTSEYFFKKSLDGLVANNVKDVYDNMRLSRIYNPYNERVILNFSQTNLIIANNLSQKENLTEDDRQTIARAIQAAISEAKELIKLNPNKAQHWENLANIYRTMIPLAEGSDAWTVSAYQRAIILDPQNPSYRLALGSVYYLLQRYPEAISFFEQAAALKPDWANAYYNLSWTYYQNNEFEKATLAMQNVVNLVDRNTNPEDWQKANEDLEQFKKQLPIEEDPQTDASTDELKLPESIAPTIEPKIELPKEASPEAN